MSEPMQVTKEQLQAILDALNTAVVSTYHGYQFTDSDVQQVNQQLQNSGIEVDLSIVRVDFADSMGGVGGLQQAFQGIEHAIEQGFTSVIKHAFDTGHYAGGSPSSGTAKLDELTMKLKDIQTSIDNAAMNMTPPAPANLFNVEQKLDALTASIDGLAEAAILGTRGEPIPKDKAQRAAKKVYDALQSKPEVYEALTALLRPEIEAEVTKAHAAKLSEQVLGHAQNRSGTMAEPENGKGADKNKLLEALWDNTAVPPDTFK